MGLSYIFISHDMAVVEQVSHRVAVMYMGQIVEIGSREAVFENPAHDYTRALLEAVPVPDPSVKRERILLTGTEIPSPVHGLDYQPDYVDLKLLNSNHFAAV